MLRIFQEKIRKIPESAALSAATFSAIGFVASAALSAATFSAWLPEISGIFRKKSGNFQKFMEISGISRKSH